MRVLVACEFSGIVSQAFRDKGHNAISCDLLENELTGNQFHHQGDVLNILDRGWDLMIAHPPCTHLAVSGSRWFKDKQLEQKEALEFVTKLMNAPIYRICIENPVSIISTQIRKPDQIIQPWMFGHLETKKTCLWLKNLPLLVPTDDVSELMQNLPMKMKHRVHFTSPGPNRWKIRSRTFENIAKAMADQWDF